MEVRSPGKNSTFELAARSCSLRAAALPFSGSRPTIRTLVPRRASSKAISFPIPSVPPVTRAFFAVSCMIRIPQKAHTRQARKDCRAYCSPRSRYGKSIGIARKCREAQRNQSAQLRVAEIRPCEHQQTDDQRRGESLPGDDVSKDCASDITGKQEAPQDGCFRRGESLPGDDV